MSGDIIEVTYPLIGKRGRGFNKRVRAWEGMSHKERVRARG